MTVDNLFLDELRLMFMRGATPSCLIRHIAGRHDGEDSPAQSIQTTFFRAFNVGPIRLSKQLNWQQLDEETSESLNLSLIPEMIEAYPEWGSHLTTTEEPFWGDLNAKRSVQFLEEAAPERVPELAGVWDGLDSESQNALSRIIGNLAEMHQNSQILARLSERLQRQIGEQPADSASRQS